MKSKLSSFIDILIDNKFDVIVLDKWRDKKTGHNYYAIDLDTRVSIQNTKNPLLTQFLHFAVCPESGLVLLSKDEYDEFREYDVEFAKKYYEILKVTDNKKLSICLDKIIDSTVKELKLNREENIKKLIG